MRTLFSSFQRSYNHQSADWGGMVTLLIVIVMFTLGTETVFGVVGEVFRQLGTTSSTGEYIAGVIVYAVQMAAVWLLIIRRYNLSWRDFGFRPLTGRDWVSLIPWSIGAILLSFLALWITSLFWAGESTKADNIESAGFILSMIMVSLIAPIVEETAFRGVIYGYLRSRFGVTTGIVLSGLLFGFAHAPSWEIVPNASVMGFLFAFAYERSGSLWIPIMLHGLLNGLTTIVFFIYILLS